MFRIDKFIRYVPFILASFHFQPSAYCNMPNQIREFQKKNNELQLFEYENRILIRKMKEIEDNARDLELRLNESERIKNANGCLKEENKQLAETNAEYLEAMKAKDCEILDNQLKVNHQKSIKEFWSSPMMQKTEEQKQERRRKLEKNNRIYKKRNDKLKDRVCVLQSELDKLRKQCIFAKLSCFMKETSNSSPI